MRNILYISAISALMACQQQPRVMQGVTAFQTSAAGDQLAVQQPSNQEPTATITLHPEKTFQVITGFGGAFTESSAYVLNQVSKANRTKVLNAYFSEGGANYSLTRTHMNSCDFSLNHYSYAPVVDDMTLDSFSIEEDRDDIIPMIKEAQAISTDGFKILASPWTAPPWMKDNKEWVGGKLLPEYYDVWALFFSKYADAYKAEGIDIWGFTVENEPLGNNNNWESMHFTPQEMTDFVQHHLGPTLEKDGKGELIILGYDQNREGIREWVDNMYQDEASSKYFDGTAIHWYESTSNYFPEELQYGHAKAPNKYLINTEACVDSEIPKWKDDAWYWSKEATDWGWDWAAEGKKHLHPKYVPTYRYARDIIGCLNNHVDGWIDWNMVLDIQGGPNWFKNWCVAPVIVDTDKDEVYFTPLFYVLNHFSKFIRPGAKRIDFKNSDTQLQVTAAQNPDGSIAVVVLNMAEMSKNISVQIKSETVVYSIAPKAIQTIIIL
ncbi:MAG: glucosylceramidase [Salibacteraceae bacterium]|jgi:glucosylceramidase